MSTSGATEAQAQPGAGSVVLVGYADEPAGRAAVQTAAELAQGLGRPVHVVYAIPFGSSRVAPGLAGGVGASATSDVQDQQERTEFAVRQQVQGLLGQDSGEWTLSVEVGAPAEVLQQQAEQHDAAMVVVGARRGGLSAAVSHLLQGSTVRGLERRSRRPVLLVPDPSAAD